MIYGSGDEVAIDFDPSSQIPLNRLDTRLLLLRRRFAKDMDFYAAHGDTVAHFPSIPSSRIRIPPAWNTPKTKTTSTTSSTTTPAASQAQQAIPSVFQYKTPPKK